MNENASKAIGTIAFCATPILFYILRSSSSKPLPKKTLSKTYTVVEDNVSSTSLEVKSHFTQSSDWNSLGLERPMVIAMVGLPARGKSYLVKMIQRYLNWTGYDCEVFNVGKYRRKQGLAGADASFFSTTNENAGKLRESLAMEVQNEMYLWLKTDPHVGVGSNPDRTNSSLTDKKRVAIFDATNTTKSRRSKLMSRAHEEGVSLLFVESICDDAEVLDRNYNLKLDNDDYKGMDPVKAKADFLERVKAYEAAYETIEDEENYGNISYIKLINVGQKIITRNCAGYLPSQVAFHLQNVHIQPRRIYLTLISEVCDMDKSTLDVAGMDPGGVYTYEMQDNILDLNSSNNVSSLTPAQLKHSNWDGNECDTVMDRDSGLPPRPITRSLTGTGMMLARSRDISQSDDERFSVQSDDSRPQTPGKHRPREELTQLTKAGQAYSMALAA